MKKQAPVKMYSVADAAAMLGITRSMVTKYCRSYPDIGENVSGVWVIPPEGIERIKWHMVYGRSKEPLRARP